MFTNQEASIHSPPHTTSHFRQDQALLAVHVIDSFGYHIAPGFPPVGHDRIEIVDIFCSHNDLRKPFGQNIIQRGTEFHNIFRRRAPKRGHHILLIIQY